MKKIKLTSADIEIEVNEDNLNDWRYMDYLTRYEDMELREAERFRSFNKAMEMLIGREQKDTVMAEIAKANKGFVSYESMYDLMHEIVNGLKKSKK